MLYFENDYSHGAHPAVLRRLAETNLTPQPGYGADAYSENARRLIRQACGAPEADVYFISGGTQTNALVCGSLPRAWEGVVCASTGHINAHEAGAVEFSGRKILPLPQREGKLDAGALRGYLQGFFADPNHEHMVFPGMVYISHPTEYGTLYSLEELTALSRVCREYRLPLFVDGARLAYALGADTDVTLPELAGLADVFSVGGTKCGALCGEALVFPRGAPEHFLTVTKQRGAMLAKGRLCGAQFEALFTDGLYTQLGREAVALAMRLRDGLMRRGWPLFIDSPTNQLFPILPNVLLEKLGKAVTYSFWEPYNADCTVIRLAVSWATTGEDVDALLRELDRAVKALTPPDSPGWKVSKHLTIVPPAFKMGKNKESEVSLWPRTKK